MVRRIILPVIFFLTCMNILPAIVYADTVPYSEVFIDTAMKNNDLDMAVKILVNEDIQPPVIINKARTMGYGFIQIIDALAKTELTDEQVITVALQNNIPSDAIFKSNEISGSGRYTPDSILRFAVEKKLSLESIINISKGMASQGYTKYDIMFNLCEAEANNETIAEVSRQLEVPPAITLKACPKHAEYGQAFTRHALPQQAHIVVGVGHITSDDSTRKVLSPKSP